MSPRRFAYLVESGVIKPDTLKSPGSGAANLFSSTQAIKAGVLHFFESSGYTPVQASNMSLYFLGLLPDAFARWSTSTPETPIPLDTVIPVIVGLWMVVIDRRALLYGVQFPEDAQPKEEDKLNYTLFTLYNGTIRLWVPETVFPHSKQISFHNVIQVFFDIIHKLGLQGLHEVDWRAIASEPWGRISVGGPYMAKAQMQASMEYGEKAWQARRRLDEDNPKN